MYVMGVDPGKAGGVAVIQVIGRQIISLVPMFDSVQDFNIFCDFHRKAITHCWLEKAQAMPKQGVSSMFTYGQGFGEIIGVLTAQRIPFTLVGPRKWQQVIHEGTDSHLDPKNRTLQAAQRLYPGQSLLASERSKKPHLGLMDALMIAEYGIRSRM